MEGYCILSLSACLCYSHDWSDNAREEEEDYQEKIEQQLAKQDEEDIDKIKEESRRRRQAILEKYRQRHLQQVESSSDGNKNGNSLTSI